MSNTQLYWGDCLKIMDGLIADGVKVDAIITDPPYGTTACKWDDVIPFDEMWKRLNVLVKDNGAIVLFGSEPFSSALRMSNIDMYRYDWIWNKKRGTDFQLANKKPLKCHENISVFYKKLPLYNPQKTFGKPYKIKAGIRKKSTSILSERILNDDEKKDFLNIKNKTNIPGAIRSETINTGDRYPLTIIDIPKENKGYHPTQKPLALMEYLVKTYTNEGDTVLDFTMGSGTTGVACKNLNRNFIGIELDLNYYMIAQERINADNA